MTGVAAARHTGRRLARQPEFNHLRISLHVQQRSVGCSQEGQLLHLSRDGHRRRQRQGAALMQLQPLQETHDCEAMHLKMVQQSKIKGCRARTLH